MQAQKFGVITILIAILILVLNGCQKTGYVELTAKPPLQANASLPTKVESLITVNALFPYQMISKALTEALPASTPVSGRQHMCMDVEKQVQQTIEEKIGGDVGKLLGGVAKFVTKVVTVGQVSNLCLDLDYQASITRSGPVTVNPLATGLRLSVPVSVDGSAGFAGDLARFLKLDKKNFRGAIVASTNIEMGINEDWCPVIKAAPDFVWANKAELEVAGKFWIDVDSQVGPAINDAMKSAAAKIPELISCQRVKDLVSPIWHTYDVRLPVIMEQGGRLIITPQRVGFSGLSYTAAGAQLALMLTAETKVAISPLDAGPGKVERAVSIDSKPVDPAKAGPGIIGPAARGTVDKVEYLPRLEKISAQQNSLNLAIPISVSYQSIDQLLAIKAIGQTFAGSAAGTDVSIKIVKTTVYPSKDRLVIGMQFESKITKPRSLAPQGWVYFVASPKFDVATQTLTLTNVDFSRILDNDLWNAMSFLLQSKIRSTITDAAKIDLRPEITKARASLRKDLFEAAAKEGITMKLDDEFVGLTGLALTQDGLQIVVGFKGSANMVVLNKPT